MAGEPEGSISNDADFKLMEYQLAEKVQDRILQRSTYVLGSFIAGLTLLGVFGSSFLVSQISRDVEETVRTELDNDIERLRDRLTDNLADLSVSTKDINRTSELAISQLDSVKVEVRRLDALKNEYTELLEEVESIKLASELAKSQLDSVKVEVERIDALKNEYVELLEDVESIKLASERAFNAARQADRNTDELRSALVKSDEGAPAIIQQTYTGSGNGLSRKLTSAVISGKNFGDSPGTMQVQVLAYEIATTVSVNTPWVSVDDASIKQWSDTKIGLKFSDEFSNTLRSLSQQLQGVFPEIDQHETELIVSFEFAVITIDGISTL